MAKFDFYGLTFSDRETYRHYKEFKRFTDSSSSTHTKGFTVGVDDHCLKKLQRQFRREGYFVSDTLDHPIEQYNKETKRNERIVYLEVGRNWTTNR